MHFLSLFFSEATVELSLDSPCNDRKQKDAVKSSVLAPAAPVASSSSKAPSKTLEEVKHSLNFWRFVWMNQS